MEEPEYPNPIFVGRDNGSLGLKDEAGLLVSNDYHEQNVEMFLHDGNSILVAHNASGGVNPRRRDPD